MTTTKRIVESILTLVVLTLLVTSVTGSIVESEEVPKTKIISDAIFSIDGATLDADLLKSERFTDAVSFDLDSRKLNIPTTVERYDLVAFDMTQMNTLSKKSMPVLINNKEYEVVLERLNFENIDDDINSYLGHVKGIDGSSVLITFDESMGKEIVQGHIQLADETIYIVPVLSRADGLKTNYPLHAIYSSKNVVELAENPDEIMLSDTTTQSMCEVVIPVSTNSPSIDVRENTQTRASELDWATVTVLVATDNEFYSSETNWVSSAQSYMAGAASQYQRDDIRVDLTVVSYDASKRNILSADPRKTTDPLQMFYAIFTESYLASKNADIAVYLGGNDNCGDGDVEDGNADGTAQGIGVQYFSPKKYNNGYAWCQMVADSNPPVVGWLYDGSYRARMYCVIHEIGHIFNAHHELELDEMDSTRTNRAYSWYSTNGMQYTVMWSSYSGSRNMFDYSSPSYNGDSTHDNAGAIRAVKHEIASYR